MSAASSSGTSFLALLASYWWAFLLFGGAVLEWIGEQFDMGLTALRRASRLRHKRRLEVKRLELRIAQARSAPPAGALSLPRPGPCVHRNVKQVRDIDGHLVAWLCLKEGCDEQLPPDWAVAKEDL